MRNKGEKGHWNLLWKKVVEKVDGTCEVGGREDSTTVQISSCEPTI